MKKMSDFDKGWWNCLDSMAAEMSFVYQNPQEIVKRTMDAAGVTSSEIDYVIKEGMVREDLVPVLEEYKAGLGTAKK